MAVTSPAKDGFGPDGRKKLKNAGVLTYWPLSGASGAGQPKSWPSTEGATTPTPHVDAVGKTLLDGATTVTGLEKPSPAAPAFARFCASNCGFVELMSTGRYRCNPRVY